METFDGKFNTSKYTKWYFQIINNRKLNPIKDPTVYCEKHHILPRCMGGKNWRVGPNIVILTGREHFICHLLLTKMVAGDYKRKMFCAAKLMTSKFPDKPYFRFGSRTYSNLRKEYVESISGKNSCNYGVPQRLGSKWSMEQKNNLSQQMKEYYKLHPKPKGKDSHRYGVKMKPEHIQKMLQNKIYPKGKDHPMWGKRGKKSPIWNRPKPPEELKALKEGLYKLWHIRDTNHNEDMFYYGSLRDLFISIGDPPYFANNLQTSYKTQTPKAKGSMQGLLLVDYFKI